MKDAISIHIPKCFYCFENGLNCSFEKKRIHVITGENGVKKKPTICSAPPKLSSKNKKHKYF